LQGKPGGLRVRVIGSLGGSFNRRDHVTPYAESLLSRAKGLPIEFLGFINNRSDEFKLNVAAADIMVAPSLVEPQGLVVLEALAMGKPVIGSDTGGISEMITGEVGLLFPPADSAALARSIQVLRHDRSRLRALEANCRRYVEANFSWRQAAQSYLRVFAAHQPALQYSTRAPRARNVTMAPHRHKEGHVQ
ncbi:MAG: glycosyltransferase, partial [Gammaproteobacteria bacterium]